MLSTKFLLLALVVTSFTAKRNIKFIVYLWQLIVNYFGCTYYTSKLLLLLIQ